MGAEIIREKSSTSFRPLLYYFPYRTKSENRVVARYFTPPVRFYEARYRYYCSFCVSSLNDWGPWRRAEPDPARVYIPGEDLWLWCRRQEESLNHILT